MTNDWANGIQGELLGILVAAGIAPDKAQTNQVLTGIEMLIQRQAGVFAQDTGAANALVISPALAVTALIAGHKFTVKVNAANTGATTLKVNALEPVPIKTITGAALSAGALPAGGIVQFCYDGTNFQVI
ncbi:MAG: hypothetical protein PW790_12695 [Parvibaculaceae bacterium]|nr:hypothetical protein [Parvibaculaceae bacterium]